MQLSILPQRRAGTLHPFKVLGLASGQEPAGREVVLLREQRREVSSGPSLRKAVLCSDLGLGNSSLGPCGSCELHLNMQEESPGLPRVM